MDINKVNIIPKLINEIANIKDRFINLKKAKSAFGTLGIFANIEKDKSMPDITVWCICVG